MFAAIFVFFYIELREFFIDTAWFFDFTIPTGWGKPL